MFAKQKCWITVLALLAGLLAQADALPELTAQQAVSTKARLIDTRPGAFYNGWPQAGQTQGGHLAGALNLPAAWLAKMDAKTWQDWAAFHKLTPDSRVALYGNTDEVEMVAGYLQMKGYQQVSRMPDALKNQAKLVALPRFQQLVYPQWLHDVQQGKSVVAKPAGKYVLIEVNWGEPKDYLQGHIPGADYLDTGEIESEPLWNVVPTAKLEAAMLKHGITADTTVILYSREIMAAGRVAHTLLYAGVKDVRILDGGWQAWTDSGLPVAKGAVPPVVAASAFGVKIPAHPEIMLNMEQARKLTFRDDASLVSVRSWPEFIGQTSGYTYIKAKGDIPGARWGRLGRDAYHMDDYLNPDGTLRTADDIQQMWRESHILPSQEVSFYCGTGWGAAMAYFYVWTMGWQNISVYDGGWMEWSADEKNPRASGVRKPEGGR